MNMVSKKVTSDIRGALFSFAAICTVISLLRIYDTPLTIWQVGSRTAWGWYPMVHTHVNAFLFWHDGLFSGLSQPLAPMIQSIFYSCLFFTGSLCCIGVISKSSIFVRSVGSTLCTLLIYFLIGSDHSSWALISWAPLLACTIYFALQSVSQELYWKGISCSIVVVITVTTGAYGLLTLLAAICLACSIKQATAPHFPLLRNTSDLYFLLILCIPWLIASFITPTPLFPAYSPLGHVVPDDGLPGNILPLFGPMPPIPVIDRENLRLLLRLWTGGLLVFTIFFSKHYHHPLTRLYSAFLLLITLDVFMPEWISQIAPLATLQRVIPWQFFYPITIPLLCFVTMLFFLGSFSFFKKPLWILALFTASLSGGYLSQQSPEHDFKPGMIYHQRIDPLQQELVGVDVADDFLQYIQTTISSPSYAVLKKTGLWPLFISDIISHWQFSSLLREKPIISTSHQGTDPVSHMFDRNIGTRWSPGGGLQRGDEWIYAYLPEPQRIHGIEIVTGRFHTDFARGLRISASRNCPTTITTPDAVQLQTMTHIPAWEGSLTMTMNGYPYFGGQGGGRIYFKKPQTVRCLLIEQIGSMQGFDWSIAELRTLKYPQ